MYRRADAGIYMTVCHLSVFMRIERMPPRHISISDGAMAETIVHWRVNCRYIYISNRCNIYKPCNPGLSYDCLYSIVAGLPVLARAYSFRLTYGLRMRKMKCISYYYFYYY